MLGQLLKGRGIGLAWRETSPQHFPGQLSGAYSQKWYHNASTCAPLHSSSRTPRREHLLSALEAAGMPVLRIWDSTESQWDLHLETRTPHTQARGADCTHFCQPSGVMEAWADGAVLLAERVLHGLQATW